MVYRTIGLMSGSSLDGLDIVFAELQENAGKWSYEIIASDCFEYDAQWKKKLQSATSLSALDYQLLHIEYGHYLGSEVARFIEKNNLHYKVGLIASHGHTTFHVPSRKMTAQLGDGASIAAETGLPVVSDLRALDLAFGGQGAPIVPIGEKLLLSSFDLFLNVGGIANISFNRPDGYIAFDVCPLIKSFGLSHQDELRTYVEHIIEQITRSVASGEWSMESRHENGKLLVTGGGALNTFLIERLSEELSSLGIEVVVPEENLVKYKEALVMALIGVLRWRQEYNVLSSVTGAQRDSIGGAIWIGQEA